MRICFRFLGGGEDIWSSVASDGGDWRWSREQWSIQLPLFCVASLGGWCYDTPCRPGHAWCCDVRKEAVTPLCDGGVVMMLLHCKQVTIGRRSSCLLPHGMRLGWWRRWWCEEIASSPLTHHLWPLMRLFKCEGENSDQFNYHCSVWPLLEADRCWRREHLMSTQYLCPHYY